MSARRRERLAVTALYAIPAVALAVMWFALPAVHGIAAALGRFAAYALPGGAVIAVVLVLIVIHDTRSHP